MLLQEGLETLGVGAASRLASHSQRRCYLRVQPIQEKDVPALADISLQAFKDDLVVNGCFKADYDPDERRTQEQSWKVRSGCRNCYRALGAC